MKTKYKLLLLLLLVSSLAEAQSLNLRFSTYFYSWERADSISNDSKTSHLSGYQNLLVDLSGKKWSFNTLLQTNEDLYNVNGKGFGYSFYNMYIKGTNLFNVMDVKIGRQYLFAGVSRGAIDGLQLKFKLGKNKEYQLSGFGGALTPLTYEFYPYNSLSSNFIIGGAFSYFGVRDMSATLSYMNKNYTPPSYTALRLDSMNNTENVDISFNSQADQLIGLDMNYNYLKKHFFFGKAYFDLNSNMFYRGELNASFSVTKNMKFSAMYEYNEPQIRYNSIFWTFLHNNNQQVGGSIDYTLNSGINLFGSVTDVIFENDNSLKVQLGFNTPSYGLSYILYTGYSGESNGFNGYFNTELVKSKLSCNVGLNYSNYKLGEYAPDNQNAFSGLLGLTYRPSPHFSIDMQGQLLTNEIYKSDTRLLLGFNYWLFNKF
jgi:hypothetical protein